MVFPGHFYNLRGTGAVIKLNANIYIQKFSENRPVNNEITMGLQFRFLFKPIFLYL